jgi:hypothetical protein
MSIQLIKEANNFHRVDLGRDISIWFSYETPIAFRKGVQFFTCENVWSRTTGKHLSYLELDKNNRTEVNEFNLYLQELERGLNEKVPEV